MKLAFPLVLAAALGACTAQMSHPTKTLAEQQADIDRCTSEANRKYWMDPVAALLNAYDCLEAKGYRKGKDDLNARVERSSSEDRERRKDNPPPPCAVPCRR